MAKRVFLIVLDSFGVGEMPDAAEYGDRGANTLARIADSKKFSAENLRILGIGNIPGIHAVKPTENPCAAFGKCAEKSKGKDTTTGHWEIGGIVSETPFPTYPSGFPNEIISRFESETGRKVICNKPYSGTEVIKDYGKQQLESGSLIVYTSADSVFQIAAHESVVPREKLYEYCRIARKILCGKHGVGRVIARPFDGTYPDFYRTVGRHDFSLEPTKKTMLDYISESGKDVIAVGKINDIFAGRGITKSVATTSNKEGMATSLELADTDFEGLCFVNLVDFDMLYGHRNNVDGYAAAISEFDAWLPSFLGKLRSDDLLIITADHGCDPGDISTDHTREYIPLLVCGKSVHPVSLGIRDSFSDIGKSILSYLGIENDLVGKDFIQKLFCGITPDSLVGMAKQAMKNAYAPYSEYQVGAALLCNDGNVYTGCNIENGAFSETICAERTAFFSAVNDGKRRGDFVSIAVVGGKDGCLTDFSYPCGACRQVMNEFCDGDLEIYLSKNNCFEKYLLSELLPKGFKL